MQLERAKDLEKALLALADALNKMSGACEDFIASSAVLFKDTNMDHQRAQEREKIRLYYRSMHGQEPPKSEIDYIERITAVIMRSPWCKCKFKTQNPNSAVVWCHECPLHDYTTIHETNK